jgi:NADH:ubiquinone oxidoreductase subunit 3 (subunit A)
MIKAWKTWTFRGTLMILFTASLVFILFLANGYQYDFFSNRLRKTGIIDVTYADPEARVFLDGQRLEGRLPFVASNVLPGVYNLVVGREGYLDYAVKVNVYEDLISKINTVFLYPLDVLGNSLFLMDFLEDDKEGVFLSGGFVFKHSKNQLSWARLQEDLAKVEFIKTNVLALAVRSVQVIEKEALVVFQDGQKQIVDLVSGEVTVVNLSEKYVFAGDKWFYYDGNLLAAFDRKFSRVLWAKYLEKGLMVDSLQYFASSSRNFLNIGLGASPIIASSGGGLDDADRANESGRLYELKGNQLELLLREKIDNLQLDSSGHLYFLKNGTEIWKWQSDLKLPRLLGRFQNGVRLVSTAIKLFKTSGVLVIESGQKFFMLDESFENARELFPLLDVSQLEVTDDGRFYFLNKFMLEGSKKTRLLMLNLEK